MGERGATVARHGGWRRAAALGIGAAILMTSGAAQACPDGYPYDCGDGYCCPDSAPTCCGGGLCSANGDCGVSSGSGTCPGSEVDCGDGSCCPGGETCCGGGVCSLSGSCGGNSGGGTNCPAGYSVDCGDGSCCPDGELCCGSGKCSSGGDCSGGTNPGGSAPTISVCPAGYPVNCGDGFCCPASYHVCCGHKLCGVDSQACADGSTRGGGAAICPVECNNGRCCPSGTTCCGSFCSPDPSCGVKTRWPQEGSCAMTDAPGAPLTAMGVLAIGVIAGARRRSRRRMSATRSP